MHAVGGDLSADRQAPTAAAVVVGVLTDHS